MTSTTTKQTFLKAVVVKTTKMKRMATPTSTTTIAHMLQTVSAQSPTAVITTLMAEAAATAVMAATSMAVTTTTPAATAVMVVMAVGVVLSALAMQEPALRSSTSSTQTLPASHGNVFEDRGIAFGRLLPSDKAFCVQTPLKRHLM